MKNFIKNQKGFTLVELVVVIAIIGILAGIAVPRFLDATASARGAKIVADMRTIQSAEMIYYAKNAKYPTAQNDFADLVQGNCNALTRQYEALLAVDHVHLHFEESALDALAQAAQLENETKEDIGARRLHTLFEKMLEDISFNAGGDMPDVDVTINGDYVAEHLGTDAKKMDMRQYIL